MSDDYPPTPYVSGSEPGHGDDGGKRGAGCAMLSAGVLGGVLGAVLAVGALVGLWSAGIVGPKQPSPTPKDERPAVELPTPKAQRAAEDVSAIASKVTPSVVNVAIVQERVNPFTGERRRVLAGNGSGVIIRSDGYILTNNHVVAEAHELSVGLGLDVPARVVGRDPDSDLAVIKVDREDLPAIEMGDSSKLRVGELAVAVGSPFGLERTVTSGIVSAVNRDPFEVTGSIDSGGAEGPISTTLIQTDAAINPGNSGGALVDAQGRLIGINTLIRTGGAAQSSGVGFAIPVDFARDIADQLIKTGKVVHPVLGVRSATVTEQLADRYDLPAKSGAMIVEPVPGSPADRAGLKRGEIIVGLDGKRIESTEQLILAIRKHDVGEEVSVEVVAENGRRRTVKAKLAGQ